MFDDELEKLLIDARYTIAESIDTDEAYHSLLDLWLRNWLAYKFKCPCCEDKIAYSKNEKTPSF